MNISNNDRVASYTKRQEYSKKKKSENFRKKNDVVK